MTSHAVRELEDGTRVYSNGTRYKPKTRDQRKYRVRKPESPTAVRWRGDWIEFVELLPSTERMMPSTKPDSLAFDHYLRNERCQCEVCKRPSSRKHRRAGRKERLRRLALTEA